MTSASAPAAHAAWASRAEAGVGVRIVRARSEDAFVVAALSLQFALAMDAPREEGYLDRAAEHWVRHHEQLPTWFAEHEGQHAGYLQAAHPPETTWPGVATGTRGRLWIHAMFVAPDHRRAGIGSALLTACESWAKGAGIGVIRLRCEPGVEQFYDTAGYAPDRAVRTKRFHPPS